MWAKMTRHRHSGWEIWTRPIVDRCQLSGRQGHRVRHSEIARNGLSSHKAVPPEWLRLLFPTMGDHGYNVSRLWIAPAGIQSRSENQIFGAVALIAVRQYDTDNRRLTTALNCVCESRFVTESARVASRSNRHSGQVVSTASRGAYVTKDMRRLSGPCSGLG